MKKIFTILLFSVVMAGNAQQLSLRKGMVQEASLETPDGLLEFSIYVPQNYVHDKEWPLLFMVHTDTLSKQLLQPWVPVAKERGYILAAPQGIQDSLGLTEKINRMNYLLGNLETMFPLAKDRRYAFGMEEDGQLALALPFFLHGIGGVVACNAALTNTDILSKIRPFQFVGLANTKHFSFLDMWATHDVLQKTGMPNQLFIFDTDGEWPSSVELARAMAMLDMAAMAKGIIPKEQDWISAQYQKDMQQVDYLWGQAKPYESVLLLEELYSMYRLFPQEDLIKEKLKAYRKDRLYKNARTNSERLLVQENLVREDYTYFLEEDLNTYNFNNLGWWVYQMEELEKLEKSAKAQERDLARRLRGYCKALVDSYMEEVEAAPNPDGEALSLLWMVKTVIAPKEYQPYLKIISHSAEKGDFGTALFYLEELLKNGYTDVDTLYTLENTALLRISPDYNIIVDKYLKAARY